MGDVVGLVGDNAAGKSTFIKCVSGVYQADEGEIFFRGEPVRFARQSMRARPGSRRFIKIWLWRAI
jgi:ABC-type sugar transport system ATPase subunit